MNEQMKVWAHDCALAYIKYSNGKTHYKDVVEFAWRYAEAMQAQAEQRRAPEPDLCNHDWQPNNELSEYCEVCSLCEAVRMDW